jgi:hypothetical protein
LPKFCLFFVHLGGCRGAAPAFIVCEVFDEPQSPGGELVSVEV